MRIIFKGRMIIIAAAVFVLLIFLHSAGAFNFIENAIFHTFAPAQKTLFKSGNSVSRFFENLFLKTNQNEIDILKAQIRGLLIEKAELKILAEENMLLKKELGFSRKHAYELVGARTIGYDSTDNSPLVILQIEDEKYAPSDLAANMPIIVEDGILVGKIAQIKGDVIFMRPIISSESAIAATVLNKDYTTGVAEGELNHSIKMGMIPQTEKLKQGDLVVTSGLENRMPKGLLIGTISKIEPDPQNPFDIAYVTPLYNPKNISKIFIIKNY